jgi:hypothetical protein
MLGGRGGGAQHIPEKLTKYKAAERTDITTIATTITTSTE